MARKGKRRRKTSMITKAINILTLAIAFSPIINEFRAGRLFASQGFENLAEIYSAGMSKGTFREDLLVLGYGPIVGALAFRKLVSMVRKSARV